MKISIVTAVYNRASTIGDAIDSVACQTYDQIEYIVVDGGSNDGTLDVIQNHKANIDVSVSEPDDGIYDALNKGIGLATGEVVGFLHADDLLTGPDCIQRIADKFAQDPFDAVYSDLVYVDAADTSKITRYWKAGNYRQKRFRSGWMPPHPTVYVKTSIYRKFGHYRTDIGSAADYECMVRLMAKHGIQVGYAPGITVKMRVGGESNRSLQNRMNANQQDRQAWVENGLKPPFGLRLTKPLRKLPQFVLKPNQQSW